MKRTATYSIVSYDRITVDVPEDYPEDSEDWTTEQCDDLLAKAEDLLSGSDWLIDEVEPEVQ